MKKVLVSPGYGSGFAHGECKELAEDPELIRMVEAGEHKVKKGEEAAGDKYGEGEVSKKFANKAREICPELYLGGVVNLVVETVSGRYRIDEYDGFESIKEAGDEVWW